MKKVLFYGLLAIANVAAATTVTKGDYIFELDDKDGYRATLTGVTSKEITKIEIPVEIRSTNKVYTVTAIGEDAFNGCSKVTELTIPYNIKTVGWGAFLGCTSITNLKIADSSAELDLGGIRQGDNPLQDMPLETVYVGREIKYDELSDLFQKRTTLKSFEYGGYVTEVPRNEFMECTNLETVKLSEGITQIGSGAFYECKSLKNINIPAAVTAIGRQAFEYCASLQSIELPAGITVIDEYTFKACTSLKEVVIPEGVTEIRLYAFSENSSLEKVVIPSTVKAIAIEAFSRDKLLTEVKLPDALETIGERAFLNCKGLETIVVPAKVADLEAEVFSGCENLRFVDLPAGLKTIGNRTFDSCTKLNSIRVGAVVPPTIKKMTFTLVDKETCRLSVPEGCDAAYRAAPYWQEFYHIDDDYAGVEGISADRADVRVVPGAGCVTVSGLKGGESVRLYSVNGGLCREAAAAGSETIEVDGLGNGVYLVNVGERTVVVSVR